jgi:WD40 repeat protein
VNVLAVDPAATRLISGGNDSLVRSWQLGSSASVRLLRGTGEDITRLGFSPDGRWLASSEDGRAVILLWDLAHNPVTSRPLYTQSILSLDGGGEPFAFGPDGWILSAAAEAIVASRIGEGTEPIDVRARLSQLRDEPIDVQERLSPLRDRPAETQTKGITKIIPLGIRPLGLSGMAWSPDGKMMAFAHKRGITLWDEARKAKAADLTFEGETVSKTKLSFSPDSSMLFAHIVQGGPKPGDVILWDVGSGRRIPIGEKLHQEYWDVCSGLDPQGTPIVVGGDHAGFAQFFQGRTGRYLRELRFPHEIASLSLMPNGDLIAAGESSGRVWLHRATDGIPVATLGIHGSVVTCLAFSPDGRWLAANSPKGRIALWDVPVVRRRASLDPGQLITELEKETGLAIDGIDIVPASRP